MAETVREAIHELLEQTMVTMGALLEASDRELPMSSSHACAQGKNVWTLLTNDIDHEKIHTGQVVEDATSLGSRHRQWTAWWRSGWPNGRDS